MSGRSASQNRPRLRAAAHVAARRALLKAVVRNPHTPHAEREAARRELCRPPRDASATRVRNRDTTDGRPRGYFHAFGLSRVNLREQAHAGHLPGVRKSSW